MLAQYIYGKSGPDPEMDEAKRAVSEWPPAKEMLDQTTVARSPMLGDFVAKTSFDGWPRNIGRAAAWPLLKPFVNIPPTEHNTGNTLAHELGHIQQWKMGLPLQNDENADGLLRQLLNLQNMRESVTRPLPASAQDPQLAEGIQDEIDHGGLATDIGKSYKAIFPTFTRPYWK